MKIYLSEIRGIEWLKNCLTDTFLNLPTNKTLVFGYHYEDGRMAISESKVVDGMNETLYGKFQDEHIGFIKEPFDSDNAFFYYYLMTYVTQQGKVSELNNLFLEWKAIDVDRLEKTPISIKNGKFPINSLSSFETAIKNYIISPRKVSALLKVTELLDGYYKKIHGVSFYGGVLSEIVMGINSPYSGFIPEYDGEMRYMIIGENAQLSDEEKEQLVTAKKMFRDRIDTKKIWYDTGWYINMYDKQWRKRISDEGFFVDQSKLTNSENSFYLNPNNKFDIKEIVAAVSDSELRQKLVIDGYDGKISDVVNHELLFKYYPEIKDLRLFYGIYPIKEGNQLEYFYSSEENVLCFRGTIYHENDERILLHEMQHYIQQVEGFASGGNGFIAEIVNAIGGQYVKSYIQSYNNITLEFVKRQSEIDFAKINAYSIEMIQYFSDKYKDKEISESDAVRIVRGYELIRKSTSNQVNFFSCSETIIRIFSSFYSNEYQGKDSRMANDLQRFFKFDLGLEILVPYLNEMRSIITRSQEVRKNMGRKGWSERSLELYYHYAYKGLLGEVESRDVQQSSRLPKELQDYILPYTTETMEGKFYSVISNQGMPPEGMIPKAAIETLSNKKYVIHLTVSGLLQFFIHEIGHIVYDVLCKEPLAVEMQAEYIKNPKGFDNFEHYFIEYFIAYLIHKNIDDVISEEFNKNIYLNISTYDSMFDDMFYSQATEVNVIKLQRGLEYIKLLRSMKNEVIIPSGSFYVKIQPLREGDAPVYARISPDAVKGFIAGFIVFTPPASTKQSAYLDKKQMSNFLETKEYVVVDKSEIPETE